jgi:hypothetical protein
MLSAVFRTTSRAERSPTALTALDFGRQYLDRDRDCRTGASIMAGESQRSRSWRPEGLSSDVDDSRRRTA